MSGQRLLKSSSKFTISALQERKEKAEQMEVLQWLAEWDSDDDSDSSEEAGCDQPSTGTAGGSTGNIPADSLARFITLWTLVRAAERGDWTGDLIRRHALPNQKDMAMLNANSMGDDGMTFLHVAADQVRAQPVCHISGFPSGQHSR